ncbi:glycosyltransferase [Hutsoniella sourekii]|uniref:glycosyltransferase n=1 Tax=Hutsoniella sourekii TaxID=87650 RepID=UPI0004AC8AB3|nr:glycosyltransferase [Hutsoniella sourekii]
MNVLNIINNLGAGGVERVLMDTIQKTHEKVNHKIMIKTDQNFFESELDSLGIEVIQAPKYNLRNYLSHYRYLKNYLEDNQNKIDLIHFYCGSLNYYQPIQLANKLNIPILIHSHNSSSRSLLLNCAHRCIRYYHRRYGQSFNIACSEAAGHWMFGRSNFSLLLNGINIEKYKENYNLGRKKINLFINNPEAIVIGNVGGFTKVKNQEYLIDLLLSLNKETSLQFEIVLIGDGPLKDKVESKVYRNNLNEQVHFLGYRDDVEELLGLFDIFIMPSLYEGLPLVLLENQAVGTPILASDTIDNQSKVNKNYLEFNLNDDFNDVIEKIKYLLSIGNVGSQMQGTSYDLDVFSEKILNVYETINTKIEKEI